MITNSPTPFSAPGLIWFTHWSAIIGLAVSSLLPHGAPAALLAYDGFAYGEGANLSGSDGGSGWSAAWVAGGTPAGGATNLAQSLSYTDQFGNALHTSGGSVFLSGNSTANTSATPYREIPITRGTNDGTTTWISFLGRRAGPITNSIAPFYQRVAAVQLREAGTERVAIGRATASSEGVGLLPKDTWSLYFGGNGANTQPSDISLSNAPASLLVLRMDHQAGNDNLHLFINPDLNSEPAPGSAAVVTNANPNFNRIQLFAGNTTAAGLFAQLVIDEIRIGETFADVTPHTPGDTNPPDIVYPESFQVFRGGAAVLLKDYAALPLSGRGGSIANFNPPPSLSDQLARPTFLRSEPINAPLAEIRFFVTDLNRHLYILDKTSRTFTAYLNFQAVFPRYYNAGGFAGGLNPIAFDPEYASNGIFYTAHLEANAAGSATPIGSNTPGLDLSGYTTTPRIDPPTGTAAYESILVEWHDTNIHNTTFEGTAREIMRIGLNSRIHPLGDLLFNPLAQPGTADYRNLYVAVGDGASGETAGSTRTTPQRLDALQGKILRITPDLNLRPADELSSNGRYRIPTTGTDPNPFVSVSLAGLRKEIFAYGFRNCHRISWDSVANVILENDIGLDAWEEVNLVRKGANYGYSEREGPEQLFIGGTYHRYTSSQAGLPFPDPDTLSVAGLIDPVPPVYPVAIYSHRDGDGISSGFVYRGSLLPGLYGKYIFGDIANGRVFYADFNEMRAADDGNRNTVATTYELQLVHDHPQDQPDAGLTRWRMFDIVAVTYTNRGGLPGGQRLPGSAESTGLGRTDADGVSYGRGRADLRLAEGGDGEIYVISKSDGMIRKMTASLGPPQITDITSTATEVALTWQAVPGWNYRVQYKNDLMDANWQDLPGDVAATGITASKTTARSGTHRFFRVRWLP
jgi:hypothetical protein